MTDQDPTQRYEPPAAVPDTQPSMPSTGLPVDDATAPLPAPQDASGGPAAPPPAPVSFAAPEAGEAVGASDAVATAPVEATKGPRRGGGLRWLVVGIVALLLVGTAAGATMLLTGSAGNPDVLTWAPADSIAYAELRLDLPGTQQAELAKVMSAFPGFDDQAAFPTKLNEALDQLVGKASGGTQSWTKDIDPWFGGQVSVSVGPLPTSLGSAAADARGLVLASVDDAAKAQAWAAGVVAAKGATSSTETYSGVTVTTVTPASGDAQAKGMQAAYAVVGPVLAVGDPASVKAAIDTNGKTGLNTNAQFQTASKSVSGDRLAFAYVDGQAFIDGAGALTGPAASMLPAGLANIKVPWAVAALRAQDGSFVVDTRNPHVEGGPTAGSDTTLASVLPSTTVVLAEAHDVGQALTRLKGQLATDPALKDGVTQVEGMLQVVGGWEAVTGWMGEAGVAITRDGDTLGGGIVVSPTNPDDAGRLLTQLKGLLGLAGGGSGIKVSEEQYAGTTITVIDLGDIGSLAGAATGGAVKAPSNITISYAVTDSVVVLGYGTDFTKAVLDAPSKGTLAKTDRFSAALKQAGTTHSALLWVDATGVRDLVEAQLSGADKTAYEADAKPYLQAFDSLIATFAPGADVDKGTVILSVTGN